MGANGWVPTSKQMSCIFCSVSFVSNGPKTFGSTRPYWNSF